MRVPLSFYVDFVDILLITFFDIRGTWQCTQSKWSQIYAIIPLPKLISHSCRDPKHENNLHALVHLKLNASFVTHSYIRKRTDITLFMPRELVRLIRPLAMKYANLQKKQIIDH